VQLAKKSVMMNDIAKFLLKLMKMKIYIAIPILVGHTMDHQSDLMKHSPFMTPRQIFVKLDFQERIPA
jgi:hypothetical protein